MIALFRMKAIVLPYDPVEGKTYSLFGNSKSTDSYFETVKKVADQILDMEASIPALLEILVKYSSRKTYLKKLRIKPINESLISTCLQLTCAALSLYTQQAEKHLKHFSLNRLWDRRLGTTREQYHLYMLEIELTNRLYAAEFTAAERKIALLPYCLKDFSVNCKASLKGFDYQCQHCSAKCYENQLSKVLEKHRIEPYIWRGSDFKKLALEIYRKNEHLSVFGIACIPELVWGMRKCRINHIPVRGLPLNANRCIRWFGEFFSNSVDLSELESLLHK